MNGTKSPSIAYLLFCLSLLSLAAPSIQAIERTEGPLDGPMGRPYWLGFPHGYDPQKTYWLVAAAHGHGGTGDKLKNFTIANDRDDYIVVRPEILSWVNPTRRGTEQGSVQ